MSSTEAVAKPTAAQRFAKMGASIGSNFKPGTFIYSALFGAALGVGVAGADYLLRNIKVRFADKEHLILMSRQRYLEKQAVFYQQLAEDQQMHRLASLAQEYDPVATRMPFALLEDKGLFKMPRPPPSSEKSEPVSESESDWEQEANARLAERMESFMSCFDDGIQPKSVLARKEAIADKAKKEKVVSKAPTNKAEWSFAADRGTGEKAETREKKPTPSIRPDHAGGDFMASSVEKMTNKKSASYIAPPPSKKKPTSASQREDEEEKVFNKALQDMLNYVYPKTKDKKSKRQYMDAKFTALGGKVGKETGHNITHLRKMREDRHRLVDASKEKAQYMGVNVSTLKYTTIGDADRARKKAARQKREETDAKLMDSVGAVFTSGRGGGTAAYKGGKMKDGMLAVSKDILKKYGAKSGGAGGRSKSRKGR
ncbi:hypothetical protein FOL46_003793 [Perkinsus olseni]|uniref:Uncharacterized protein n=1 Tax=Perkinsus olseni TaxID=32597 RepID=A0A7J6M0Y8_PEROL|nr:hypothetical protein FOL46_003793 [Perkinsus olseni]